MPTHKITKKHRNIFLLFLVLITIILFFNGIKNNISGSKDVVELANGTYKVGSAIKAGRYIVTTENVDGGNLFNSDNDETSLINVILGKYVNNDLGTVDSYTVTLKKGEKITLTQYQNDEKKEKSPVTTKFSPTNAKRKYQTKLSAGSWVVGKDIKPGKYVIYANEGRGLLINNNGSLNQNLSKDAQPDIDEVTKITTRLYRGEVLYSNLKSITLKKIN
ncbi:hypothetical protein FC70_GL000727 [Paucilactobacillus oligofermentans DSM 15707 = LMG 22743]|uniref:Uncharacterized protein n=1 Tax=Paucilactobacillus oligofermentans DSM 15707 = LMG 22743 TaxID=1423778 RepID=A0A0R1RNW0_9LACO|nr:hypothetical protein [Paucilactobacillus oligofermentans]KRL55131.1 hypothetical protein FC70_GL000727 [Paucilactobacillus oligofermentans DSM 15707 = LMG 22743]CUS25881.1 Uncharacterized protein LACOL_0573 [Paucilactobacillus oligofermentans DSM 15707 = LMG 22743]